MRGSIAKKGRKWYAVIYDGPDPLTAVAVLKESYRRGSRRVYRPWIPEPGMWAQWDWGQGPRIDGRVTNLFCAWLGWSRTRVVIPTWDRTLPALVGCLDRSMRVFGGVPTYWLTDNEKTVTIDHVAGIVALLEVTELRGVDGEARRPARSTRRCPIPR
jgi:hypothetical protein